MEAEIGDACEADFFRRLRNTPDSAVVFMFPPVGWQHINMGRTLYDNNSIFRTSMLKCSDESTRHLPYSFLDALYPRSGHDELFTHFVDRPTFTFPALFAVGYSLLSLLQHHGCVPNAVLGLSIGEYVACVAAGMIEMEMAMALVCERALAMEASPSIGSMIAVKAPATLLTQVICATKMDGDVVVAALNSPNSCVISGLDSSISTVIDGLPPGVRFKRVQTTHPDHSHFMTDVALALKSKTIAPQHGVSPREPLKCRFISTVSGSECGAGTVPSLDHWSQHALQAVDFQSALHEVLATFCVGKEECASFRQKATDLHLVDMGNGMLENFARDVFCGNTSINIHFSILLPKRSTGLDEEQHVEAVLRIMREERLHTFLRQAVCATATPPH